MRQFCVDIAHSFIWRNIDAELLREHSVRRYCAYYKVCKFCVISSFASTLASKLRKKIKKKRMRKKNRMRKETAPGFEPGISHFKAATLPTEPPSFCCIHRFSSCPIYIQDAILAQFVRNFCACYDVCAEIAQFFAQLRLLRQSWRRCSKLRFKKSLFCASYKGFPAAGQASKSNRKQKKSRRHPTLDNNE